MANREFNEDEKETLHDVLSEYASTSSDVWDEADLEAFIKNLRTDCRYACGLEV